jgi:hypothetical protein
VVGELFCRAADLQNHSCRLSRANRGAGGEICKRRVGAVLKEQRSVKREPNQETKNGGSISAAFGGDSAGSRYGWHGNPKKGSWSAFPTGKSRSTTRLKKPNDSAA